MTSLPTTTPFKKQQMSVMKWHFPILKSSEVILCMTQLEVPLEAEELKKPTSDLMKRLMDTFVYLFVGISRDDKNLRQPSFQQLSLLPYPEYHEESIASMSIAKWSLKVMQDAGVHDAQFDDLVKPEFDRLKIILSALINFAKFKIDRLGSYDQYAQMTKKMAEARAAMTQRNEEAALQIAELKRKRESEEPQIKEIEKENNELASNISEMHRVTEKLREQIKLLKEACAEYSDRIGMEKNTVQTLRSDADRFKSLIVRSPEKLKKSLIDMTSTTNQIKKEVTEASSKLQLLQTRHRALSKVETRLQKRVGEMHECLQATDKSRKLNKEIKEKESVIATQERTLQEAVSQEQHLKKQINVQHEKLSRLQQQFTIKRKQAQEARAQVEEERRSLLAAAAEDKSRLEQNDTLIQQRKMEIQEMQESHNAVVGGMREKYREMGTVLKAFQERIVQAMTVGASS